MQTNGMVKTFFDFLFPRKCLMCGEKRRTEEREGICTACHSQIGYISSPICKRCGFPFLSQSNTDHFCQDCLISPPSFGIARALSRYEGKVKEAVARFKYEEMINLGETLGKLMAQMTYPDLAFGDYDLFIPVPLHPKRLKERGFNQSVILARQISSRYQVSLDLFSLRRNRVTESQVNLHLHERRGNVKGAFSVENRIRLQGKSVLLIDDVYTSGATVNECAKVLLKAGAVRVDVLTLARAV